VATLDRVTAPEVQFEEVRELVEQGEWMKARRLADKYEIPNDIRIQLGVTPSADEMEAPPHSIVGIR
jgi:hypothetical protein